MKIKRCIRYAGLALFVAGFLPRAQAQTNDSSRYFYQRAMDEKSGLAFQAAFADFQLSVHYDSSNANAIREAGSLALSLQQYEEALNLFRRLMTVKKNDTSAINGLAAACLATGEWVKAIRYASLAIQQHTGRNNYYIMGKAYYKLSDYEHALGYLPAARRDDPDSAEIPYLIARTFEGLNSYRAAIPYFQQAIALDSSRVDWIYECGQAFATVFDDRSAVQYYELAGSKGFSRDSTFYENLANSYIASGQSAKGLRMLQEQADKKPGDLKLLNRLAYANYEVKKYDEAIDCWSRILSYDKQNARALYMTGLAYQKKGDTEKGKAYCDQAIALEPALKDSVEQQMPAQK